MVKNKKLTSKQIQQLLWKECVRIINAREVKSNGTYECFTCGAKNLKGSNKQVGHMIAKTFLHNYLKYDLRLLKIQCMRCNIHCGGNGALFITNMINIEGEKYVKGILKDMALDLTEKDAYKFYQQTLEDYKLIQK